MIENLKLIRNWLVSDPNLTTLGTNITIWEPAEIPAWIYCMITTIPTSRVKQVEETQAIEIRIIWTKENNFDELQILQKSIRNNILNNYKAYWLYNIEIFNNSFWYTDQKRPWSVENYNLYKTL